MKINKTIITIGVLVLFLVGIVLIVFPSGKKKKFEVLPKINDRHLMELVTQAEPVKKVSTKEKWGKRNPFIVPKSQITQDAALELSGVFLGSDKPSAIFRQVAWEENVDKSTNIIVYVGSKINDLTVKEIKRDIVVLMEPQGKLREYSMKTTYTPTDLSDAEEGDDSAAPQVPPSQ